jgi:hypothetical protein
MSKNKLKTFNTGNITVDKNMPDYTKDPYFVKKAEKAREFIDKHGLPDSITKKKK